MSENDIEHIVEGFGQAAARAKRAGFDGIQMHAAHGYLLSQFLSPHYNKRTDRYGGKLENRARILMEAYQSIRKAVGQEFPVMVKMNSEDFLESGLTQTEMLSVAAKLEAIGIHAIELSGGTILSDKMTPVRRGAPKKEADEVYYRHAAELYKQRIKVPLMLVGGIRSHAVAKQLLDTSTTDYISLSRPLIREPHLVKRWQQGDHARAECDSDNLCFRPAMTGKGLYCVLEEKQKKKQSQA